MQHPSRLASRPAARPAPGRRARHRAETRERLFRTALALFAEHGFAATTVEGITDAADVGKGTFFNYFPSKEHVLAALGEMQLGKFQAALEAAREGREPLALALRRAVRALAEEPGRSAALVRSLMCAMLSSDPARSLVLERLARGRKILAELFRLAQKRREIRQELDSAQLAYNFQQIFFGGLFLWSLEPKETLLERQSRALRVFWSGVTSSPR